MLLPQVMDHGMLTDNNGRQASFRNCVLIMTTNSGAMEMSRESMGFQKQDNTTDGSEVIKKPFSPEFRNRHFSCSIWCTPKQKSSIL